MCPDHSYIMSNLDWNQRKMQEKNIFQPVFYLNTPEHKRRRLWRAFDGVASPCSRVEPQKEREKLSLVYAQVWVSDVVWACYPINNRSLVSGQLKKKVDLGKVQFEPAIWLRVLVSGYLNLTGVKWPEHWCRISKMYAVNWQSCKTTAQVAQGLRENWGWPVFHPGQESTSKRYP